jgi:hypothetical protein
MTACDPTRSPSVRQGHRETGHFWPFGSDANVPRAAGRQTTQSSPSGDYVERAAVGRKRNGCFGVRCANKETFIYEACQRQPSTVADNKSQAKQPSLGGISEASCADLSGSRLYHSRCAAFFEAAQGDMAASTACASGGAART